MVINYILPGVMTSLGCESYLMQVVCSVTWEHGHQVSEAESRLLHCRQLGTTWLSANPVKRYIVSAQIWMHWLVVYENSSSLFRCFQLWTNTVFCTSLDILPWKSLGPHLCFYMRSSMWPLFVGLIWQVTMNAAGYAVIFPSDGYFWFVLIATASSRNLN